MSKKKKQTNLYQFKEFKAECERFDVISPLIKKLPKFKEDKVK